MNRSLLASFALAAVVASGCTVHVIEGANAPAASGSAAEPAAPTPAPPASSAAPAPLKKSTAVQEGDSIKIPGNIVFETGKATLQAGAGSEEVLEQLRIFLVENPQVTKLRVEGHTDNVGKPEDNVELSGQRALTIKKWLVAKGIPAERILAVGFGQGRPIADNSTDPGRAQNRRTEFKLAELNGKKYLGMDPTGGAKVFE